MEITLSQSSPRYELAKLGDKKTVLRNPKDEIKIGTLHAMLKQLGVSEQDL